MPAQEDLSTPAVELRRRFWNLRTLLSFLVAAGLIALAIWRLEVDPAQVWAQMRQADPLLFGLGFLAFYSTFPLRAWRWRILLENAAAEEMAAPAVPRLPDLVEIIYLSWFANCIVPAKLGDLYRGYLLNRTTRASFSRTVGTIFAERVLDMLFLFLLMLAAGLALFGPRVPAGRTGALVYGFGVVLVLVAVGALLGLRFFGPTLRRLVPVRFRDLYDRFLEGTLLSFRRRNLGLLLVQTLLVWLLESTRFYCVVRSLPERLPLGLPVIVFFALASSLLTTLPITPAGLGAVEAVFVGFLPLFLTSFPPEKAANLAGAVVILDRLINYWSIVLLGALVFFCSKKK